MSDQTFTISKKAPAASNYYDKIGYVVRESTSGECVLAGAASGTMALRPLGVIVNAENQEGGRVEIAVHGPMYVYFGGTVTTGTHTLVKSNDDSEVIAMGDSDFCWTVGWFMPKDEDAAAADTELKKIFVCPALVSGSVAA